MGDMQPLADRAFRHIQVIRGEKVLLDQDLAAFYGVETRFLIQAIKRNRDRFPSDFMFQLTDDEFATLKCQNGISNEGNALRMQMATSNPKKTLRSQFVISNGKSISRMKLASLNVASRGGRRYPPYAFTEQGVAMLSGVLRSPRAVQVNIAIMRAFVRLRDVLSTHRELAAKLAELETKIDRHDRQILALFDSIHELMEPPDDSPKPPIGFQTEEEYRKLPTKRGPKTARGKLN